MQRADIERGAAIGAQVDGSAGVGGHRIEVTGMKMQRLAFARGRAIGDIPALQAALRKNVVVDLLRKLQRIALAHAVDALDEARFGAAFDIEQCDLDCAGSDIDPCSDGHGILLLQETTARRANSAAPSAPV